MCPDLSVDRNQGISSLIGILPGLELSDVIHAIIGEYIAVTGKRRQKQGSRYDPPDHTPSIFGKERSYPKSSG